MLQGPLVRYDKQLSPALRWHVTVPSPHVECAHLMRRYASEVSGISAYSTAAGPYHQHDRGAPPPAGSDFDAAFEQGYRYAGAQMFDVVRLAAGQDSAAVCSQHDEADAH